MKEDRSPGCGGIDVRGEGGGSTNAFGTINDAAALDAVSVLGLTSVSIGGMILGFDADAPRDTPCGFLDMLPRPFFTLPTAKTGLAGDRICTDGPPAFTAVFFGDLDFLFLRVVR